MLRTKPKKWIELIIFNVKWILILFYLGLIGVLLLYTFAYARQIIAVFNTGLSVSTDVLKLYVLDTIDIVMIANLVKMIIAGSYNSFVSKTHGIPNENVSSGLLKIKITTSVIVVATIHLLKTFISDVVDPLILNKDLKIFGAFLVAAVVLGALELMHVYSESMEEKEEKLEASNEEVHEHNH